MPPKETAIDFHQYLANDDSLPDRFNVYKKELGETIPISRNRRDFYKISLLTTGEGLLSYDDRVFHIKGHMLGFFNPLIPYSWQPISQDNAGYFCLFTDDFVNPQLTAESLANSPLFKVGGIPILELDAHTERFLQGIFEQMLAEMKSSYTYKYELMRSYVQIIIHEAMKMESLDNTEVSASSAVRLSNLFIELLERQFSTVSPECPLQLKTAGEFAERLSVHINHLNRVLKNVTGKTTSEHLAARTLREARSLLLHCDWSISEIGYCLGFRHASNFNIFFKRQTGQSPHRFRQQRTSIS